MLPFFYFDDSFFFLASMYMVKKNRWKNTYIAYKLFFEMIRKKKKKEKTF